jgi:predicted dehydrogenase
VKKFKKARDIKVGVIGYSGAFGMGKVHLDDMKAAGMTPTAVCEINKKQLKVAEKDWPGIETYDSITKMLKKSDVDLIAVITPHNLHAKHVLQCLNAGRSVCCEKPLAITTEECDKMIAAAKKNRCVLTTYHNRHWDGCALTGMKLIPSGVIGDVVRIEAHMGSYSKPGNWWRSSKSISGGVLYDWGVHVLEYALQIMQISNAKMTEVMGLAKTGYWAPKTKWKADTNEDEGFVVVRFDTGQWLTLNLSSIDSNPKPSMLEITGTKGTYLMNHGDYEIIQHKANGQTVVTKGSNIPGDWSKFYKNVADHMVKKTPLIITPEWSRRPIHIIDLANKSAKLGRALKTKYA